MAYLYTVTVQLSVQQFSVCHHTCLSVLPSYLSGLLCVSWCAYLSVLQLRCVLMFLCLVSLPVRAVIRQLRYRSVSQPVCLLFIYLFIVLSVSLVFSVWSEARLLSFTVKCSADWKGHFSNGAALPLIFCLSLGVRLIYHASSPADIQIHFDWRLDGMTPTTTNAANITAVLTRMHKKKKQHTHTQSNVIFCILKVRDMGYSGYEYADYANTYPLTLGREDMHLHIYTHS